MENVMNGNGMQAAERTTALMRVEPAAIAAWTPEQVDAVKRQICPKGISDDELALFVSQCQRSGLDPFQKQAFCVPRRANVGTRDQPKWVTKHEFQPAEAGMLARAEDFPDFRGVTAAPVFAKDKCEIDNGEGIVHHVVSVTADRGALAGAWARGIRDGRVPVVVYLRLGDYIQESPLWKKLAPTMITKCARVAVLRVLFAKQFGGLYIAEEMPAPAAPRQVRQVSHYQVPQGQLQAPAQETAAEDPLDGDDLPGDLGDPTDAGPQTEGDPAVATVEEQIAGWTTMINDASDKATLSAIGEQLTKDYPDKTHPVRLALRDVYGARLKALR